MDGRQKDLINHRFLPALRSSLNRRIPALSERKINALHDEIMDFAAFFERSLSQRLVDGFRQVQQCRQSASGGSIFGSYLAAIAYNEDSPHCPAARGKILWRKI
jgi:hypothetical protein